MEHQLLEKAISGGYEALTAHAVSLPALVADERAVEVCALGDALTTLAAFDPRRAKVIELRFFGGLTVEETAEAVKYIEENRNQGVEDLQWALLNKLEFIVNY